MDFERYTIRKSLCKLTKTFNWLHLHKHTFVYVFSSSRISWRCWLSSTSVWRAATDLPIFSDTSEITFKASSSEATGLNSSFSSVHTSLQTSPTYIWNTNTHTHWYLCFLSVPFTQNVTSNIFFSLLLFHFPELLCKLDFSNAMPNSFMTIYPKLFPHPSFSPQKSNRNAANYRNWRNTNARHHITRVKCCVLLSFHSNCEHYQNKL